ncbi:MAG: helix-turn-helix transcriptional regulator [Methanobrevibacter sp.]|jgi:predicted transcriptional regulator|uniref:helix-turn-helix domain-containing protein n=1 Tax=Methanobrevibacter sp. TaxID=66852 RepID=UPI0025DE40B7|nr:helix-turn-helix domain-containing protein [Methanobrevibacter sp.]MBE6497417.1 helix-turn-helix transcriptional regulator [Methanobrevibacter sp.]
MNEKQFFYYLGYVKVSTCKIKILKSLEKGIKMPTEIAKDTNLGETQVSNTLSNLKKNNLVVCLNEELSKGRLYQITDNGKEIVDYLNKENK